MGPYSLRRSNLVKTHHPHSSSQSSFCCYNRTHKTRLLIKNGSLFLMFVSGVRAHGRIGWAKKVCTEEE